MVLTFGSFAMGTYEACQVRNEAALSKSSCVPKGSLDRANCIGNVCGLLFEVRRAVFQFIIVISSDAEKYYYSNQLIRREE